MFSYFFKTKKGKTNLVIAGLSLIIVILFSLLQQPFNRQTTRYQQAVHFTRANMNQLQEQMQNVNYRMPNFNADKLGKTIPNAKVYDQNGQAHQVVLWDSWPVTDQEGTLANYHGYHLTIALSAVDKRRDKKGVKMVLLAQKANAKNQGVASWTYLGPLMNTFTEGSRQPDRLLSKINNEWSGSAVLMNEQDDHIRLFYTGAMTKNGQAQALTTAQISIQAKDKKNWASGLTIAHEQTTDHKTVFSGDGQLYQKVSQLSNQKTDSFAMRDPHFVVDHGHYYLVFEANTTESGQQVFNNPANYGSLFDYQKDKSALLKSHLDTISQTSSVSLSNASKMANSAIGLVELNRDFTVKKVEKPLMVASGANDITERPNLLKYQGKWYLFTCFQGKSLASSNKQFLNQNYLLGYVSSDGLTGHYQKLNKTGLVLGSNSKRKTKKFTYAYLVVPSKENGQTKFVITAFAGDRTLAPSVALKINKQTTKVDNQYVFNQGALTTTGKRFKTSPQNWS
ncbi:glycoside hydrolase family 68 protein [Fructobacillus sp. M1-13]|uniref:Glycoside hydrolase family 68 protein n=1 Tax=Fructobacillus papyriferae TaxID=2713171 RepID=A0ABS5QPI2_9LACO|nr:glycoside hydrolase family 68 protein [Fructobacillus papyriferae]MBS9335061.1 glycoside hydrolase family 68 protein [Fructobacillus papyriferae]MCD2159453.1 glycoside hydrolase family 68 protein [Fructobacillus papyriferae]